MAKSSKELAPVSEEKPSYLVEMEKKGPVSGSDNFTEADYSIPQIKLLQGTSPELDVFDDAKPGIYWHTGYDKPLGKEIDFVVCGRNRKYLLTAPLHDGQNVLARADDATTWDRLGSWEVQINKDSKRTVTWAIEDTDVLKSGLTEWGTSDPEDENSPPAATLFYDYIVILPEYMDLGPAALSLTRSKIKKARKGLNDKIKLHQQAGRPMQSIVFRATVSKENSESGDFNNVEFRQNGFASKELFEMAMELSALARTAKIRDEVAAAEPEVEAAESNDF